MKKLLYVGVLAALSAILWPGSRSTPQTNDPVLIGAGDIVDGLHLDLTGATATAALIDVYPTATVFVDGDLTHNNGTDTDYARDYDPAWGRFRGRTLPVTGNHEYNSLNSAGLFNYFGPAAGDPTKGYYSQNLGAWHIIVLNSNCSNVGGCGSGSPQEQWLVNDLVTHPNSQFPCTVALWHHPYYTSVAAGQGVSPDTEMQPIWQDLYTYQADLIVNGHAHNYERFAPQDANGNSDTATGIVEIISGTGGTNHMTFGTAAANSLVRNGTAFGVLKLTLHASSYDFQFIPIAGQSFTDSGTQLCH